MLSDEHALELKKQLREQIKDLPEPKKIEAEREIDELSNEALEEMLVQQKKAKKTPLRMIVAGELPAYTIAETQSAIAVLEIHPISKGHVIVISKEQKKDASELQGSFFSLAKRIAARIRKKLNPKNIEMQTEIKFGEPIINIIPLYEKPLTSRYEASKQELLEIQEAIKLTKRKNKIKVKKTAPVEVKKVITLKRRRA